MSQNITDIFANITSAIAAANHPDKKKKYFFNVGVSIDLLDDQITYSTTHDGEIEKEFDSPAELLAELLTY